MSLALWIAPAALLFLGAVALVVVGLRGPLVDHHSRCRKCSYDLSGSTASPTICPECGAALASPKAVRVGSRRKRPAILVCGTAMLALLLLTGGWFGWWAATDFDWNTIKPVWLLKHELAGANAARATRATDELVERLWRTGKPFAERELSRKNINDLVELVLALQADPSHPWDTRWGYFVEQAWHDDRTSVSQEQLTRYLRTAVDEGLRITARRQVRSGASLPLRLDYRRCRVGPAPYYTILRFRSQNTTLGEQHLSSQLLREEWEMSSFNGLSEHVALSTAGMAPGNYVLRVQYEVDAIHLPSEPVVASWTSELTTEVTVLPPNQPTVVFRYDDDLADAVGSAIAVAVVLFDADSRHFDVARSVIINSPPVDLAFDIRFAFGTESIKVAEVSVSKGESPKYTLLGRRAFLHDIISGRSTVDVILKPSEDVAERTLGIVEIWGETLEFNNVPVRMSRGTSQ